MASAQRWFITRTTQGCRRSCREALSIRRPKTSRLNRKSRQTDSSWPNLHPWPLRLREERGNPPVRVEFTPRPPSAKRTFRFSARGCDGSEAIRCHCFIAAFKSANQRKRELLDHVETNLDEQDDWRKFNAAYHEDDYKFMRFLIPPGKRVLELGCGSGHLLAALQPSYGVGVDFSSKVLAKANALYPASELRAGRRRRSGDAGRESRGRSITS